MQPDNHVHLSKLKEEDLEEGLNIRVDFDEVEFDDEAAKEFGYAMKSLHDLIVRSVVKREIESKCNAEVVSVEKVEQEQSCELDFDALSETGTVVDWSNK